jgi:hypothetical protein
LRFSSTLKGGLPALPFAIPTPLQHLPPEINLAISQVTGLLFFIRKPASKNKWEFHLFLLAGCPKIPSTMSQNSSQAHFACFLLAGNPHEINTKSEQIYRAWLLDI